jgi:ATP-dependent protease ClpP protease subunit
VAEIRIDGPIGAGPLEESVNAKRFVADLGKLKSSEINLYLNSPGGSVMDANVIYAALQRHPAKVNIIVDGWALSAASMIAMAGDTVSMGKRSMMMLHNPHTVIAGNAAAIRKTADMLDKIKLNMMEVYGQRLQGTPDEIAAILDAETWYSADEAVNAGLADQVIPDSRLPAPVPTSFLDQISLPAAFAAYTQNSEAPVLDTQEFESKIASLEKDNSELKAQIAAEKAAKEAIEGELNAVKAAAKLASVKALFAELGKDFTDEAAAPFLALPESALALMSAEFKSLTPKLDPALTQQIATAGAAGPDILKLNAKLMAQVATGKE